jgi:hypothetical protein
MIYFNNRLTITQDSHADINTQLRNGIRFFDFRFNADTRHDLVKPGHFAENLKLMHTFDLKINLKQCLDPIKSFLEENPTEVVFVSLQPDGDDVDGRTIIYPEYLRGLFNEYKTNKSLPSAAEIELKTGYKLNGNSASPNNLFVEGWKDFETIRQLRPYKGLGNLSNNGTSTTFNLTEGNVTQPYSDFKEIKDPRKHASLKYPIKPPNDDDPKYDEILLTNPRLDYSGLALGDVRGKIILIESLFKEYPRKGWVDQDTENGVYGDINVNPLDVQGRFTTGRVEQNNYSGPLYPVKKEDISGFWESDNYINSPHMLPINYTSAAQTPADVVIDQYQYSPASYALSINSGPSQRNYKIPPGNVYDGEQFDTLASWLHRNTRDGKDSVPDGSLTQWNLNQKLNNSKLDQTGAGLRGIMTGDFYTTSKAWYNEFWNRDKYSRDFYIPSPNSGDYPPSDWLTSKIWKQSAILTPRLQGSTLRVDPITGLQSIQEGKPVSLRWNNFLGTDTPAWATPQISANGTTYNLKFRLSLANIDELGFTEDQIQKLQLDRQKACRLSVKNNATITTSEYTFGVPLLSESSGANISYDFDFAGTSSHEITGLGSPGVVDGNHIFRIQLIASSGNSIYAPIGTPTYFLILD